MQYKFIPYQHKRLDEAEQLAASRQFLATMAARRTIRNYSSEPVLYELIENAVRAASLAPSGANQQPWTFVVVSNPELKRQLRVAAEAEEKEAYFLKVHVFVRPDTRSVYSPEMYLLLQR